MNASTPDQYMDQLPDDRKQAIGKLRKTILDNLPSGFVETMNYGMIGYVIPHTLYPKGYHCDPKLPLPFMNIASQKNFISVHHMGIYASADLLNWLIGRYSLMTTSKPDMGKGCIRFKKMDQIPYSLIGELAAKITAAQWIEMYETNFHKS